MRESFRCEYAVVGTGAGGSVAGALLAEAGHHVLFLEEGERLQPERAREVGWWIRHTYRSGGIFPFLGSPLIPFAEGRCVGGGTVINGALLWRTPPWILEEWEHAHGLTGYDGEHLAKHFTTVERDLRVITHRLNEEGNKDSLALHRGASKLGWASAMAPRAVKPCGGCAGGCFSCGKQSTLENYLPRALAHNAQIVTNCRVVKIVHRGGRARQVIARVSQKGRVSELRVDFDHLVLAAGAVQTPHLLDRSGLHRAGAIQFHLNLKVVAVFPEELNAHQSTIFTVQVQEFAKEGMVIMATYLTSHMLALTLARHGVETVNFGLRNYFKSAIYTTMIRSKSRAHIVSGVGDQPVVWYRMHSNDVTQIKAAVRRTAEVLLCAGATALYLPIKGTEAVGSLEEVDRVLAKLKPAAIDGSIMHVMASCPMGGEATYASVRPDGRMWDAENVTIADASMLPSNIGESPQGTIMAFVHEIIGRHLSGPR